MSTEFNVNSDVVDLVNEIIAENGFGKETKITYAIGSQTGDGFLSRNIAVTISDDEKVLDLFLKYGLNIQNSSSIPTEKLYANEIHFYDKISPAFAEFLQERNVSDGFTNLAKCYGTSKKNIIVLENLKKIGYQLCDKTKPLNDKYVSLVFKTFAKFHAVSFALKDQNPELYQKLISIDEITTEDIDNQAWDDASKINIDKFLASLDPVKDKHILDRTRGLAQRLLDVANRYVFASDKSEYDILIQGDSWCNNMMFLFEENNKDKPIEIVLVDWQVIRVMSPVFDLAYFLYSSASEEVLNNIDDYLKLYHEELSDQIRKMGSKPDVLYPYSVFEQHWRDNAEFGLYIAFTFIKIMLSEEDEHLDFEIMDLGSTNDGNNLFRKIKKTDEYYRRVKIVLEHVIQRCYI